MHKVKPLNPSNIGEDNKLIYPEIYIKETDLPNVKDWKIDDEYMIKIKVKVKGVRERRATDIEADAEIREIGLV